MPFKPPSFRPGHLPTRQQQVREYDQHRGSARERGYTKQWDNEARRYKYEHPLCLGCSAIGRTVPTTVVDHVEPHKGDQEKFWRRSNWQPACDWHHDVVKQRLELMWVRHEINTVDLRLDSQRAIALSRKLLAAELP